MADDAAPEPAPEGIVAWDRHVHGAEGIPPCRKCGSAMVRAGGRYGLQLWSDHWLCPGCGWELRLSYGRGCV